MTMFSKFFSKLEKLDWVATLPWNLIGIVLAASFVVATSSSVLVSHFLVPDLGIKKASKSASRSNFVAPTVASISKTGVSDIIRRNIFSSDGKTPDDIKVEDSDKREPIGDEILKSDLSMKVLGIIYGGKPNSGLALIENSSKKINSFMVGDQIMKKVTIFQIQEDRIIINREGRKEYILLERTEIVRSKRQKSKKKKPSKRSGKLAPIAVDPPPDNYKEEGFERDGSKIVMTQEFKKRMLTGDFAQILQDAKAEPNMVGGELKGFKLNRIREGSIYQKAGLQNGDIVLEINGIPLNDAGQAVKLLNQMKNESNLEVRLERGGMAQNVNVEIR